MAHGAAERSSALDRALPGLADLRRYQRPWLRGDVVAGVTVAAYLVPQCMAYADVAGLPPVVGLWAVLLPMATYALVGSSRQLSVGPETTTAVMAASIVAPLAAGDPARYAALAAGLAVLVGAVCLVAWLARLGFLANLLSRPVLVGYMAGIAIIMIVGQLEKLTGIPVEGDSLVDELRSLVDQRGQLDAPTLVLGLSVVVFLFVVRARFPKAPGPLLAVALSAAAVAVFDLQDQGIAVVGTVPQGLPGLAWPDLDLGDLASLVGPAVGVALVGYSDNVLTARAFASRHHQEIDANQELLALGVANLGAGATQGFPVSSSGSRTAIGDSLGSATQLFSLVVVGCLVAVLLVAAPLLETFPSAALGGIVVYAAWSLIDRPELRRLRRFRRSEFLLALGAMAGVLAFDILVGVLVAVGLSVIELFSRLMHPHDAVLGEVPGLPGLHDVDDFPSARLTPGLLVYRYDAPLIFANAEDFRHRALAELAGVDRDVAPVSWFVLNMEANVEVDITGLDALEQLRAELVGRGITFGLARVKQDLMVDLERSGLLGRIGEDHVFPTLPTARKAFERQSRPDDPALDAWDGRGAVPPPGTGAAGDAPEPPTGEEGA